GSRCADRLGRVKAVTARSAGREAPALTRPSRSAISLRQDDSCSFDHLVGAGEHRSRNLEAQCLRSFQADQDMETGCQHRGWFACLLTLHDPADVVAGLAI